MSYKSSAAPGMKHRDFHLDIKAVNSDGFFSGYGSVFNVVDSYREAVAPGAFEASLKELQSKGRKVPILWQHNSREPLGAYTVVKEDKVGLYLEGQLLINDIARAKEAYALMQAGAVTGLSIGYYVRDSSYDEKERITTLKQLDLSEVSVVTFPALDVARVDSVKSALANGDLPTLPEFESFLREAGFSKTQAAAVASHGLKHLIARSESAHGNAGNAGSLLTALQSLQITL